MGGTEIDEKFGGHLFDIVEEDRLLLASASVDGQSQRPGTVRCGTWLGGTFIITVFLLRRFLNVVVE